MVETDSGAMSTARDKCGDLGNRVQGIWKVPQRTGGQEPQSDPEDAGVGQARGEAKKGARGGCSGEVVGGWVIQIAAMIMTAPPTMPKSPILRYTQSGAAE